MMYNNYKWLKSIGIMIDLLIISSLIGMLFKNLGWPDTNIILIYILSVLMTSRLTQGYIYGIVCSIIATFMFNYFFTAPFYTFSVYDSKYFVTFVVMTITAIITSASTTRIQHSTQIANENAHHMKTLYTLTNRLSDTLDDKALCQVVIEIFSDVLNCQIGCICFHEQVDQSVIMYGKNNQINESKIENIREYQGYFQNMETLYLSIDHKYHYPLYGIHKILGVLIFPKETIDQLDENQKKLLTSMNESVSLALDHIFAIKEQLRLKETTVKERYRSNLLRAISHDLRTPLSGIMGTSEMIMDMKRQDCETFELVKGIYEEASWLYLLVENILSLTKVQEGQLVIHKQLEALEEVIGSAVYHVTKNQKNHHIQVHVPEQVLMVPMDAQLIQQVLINLLNNAMKHTLENQPICINAYQKNKNAYLEVEDYGKGLKTQDPDQIFEMFYTNNTVLSDGSKGIGLGLTICKAIIEAHGGTIEAKNCKLHSGAKFIIRLPMEEPK